jgi:hypothetical protein
MAMAKSSALVATRVISCDDNAPSPASRGSGHGGSVLSRFPLAANGHEFVIAIMKTTSLLHLVQGAFIALLAFTLGSTAAQAAPPDRTWVSGTGDNANPCSRAQPCLTFNAALGAAATGGEINCVNSGNFSVLTINSKSIVVDGEGAHAGISEPGAIAIYINGAGAVVTLRNLALNGLGNSPAGISIVNASEVNIENCFITGFYLGVDIQPSAACSVTIKNTIIRRCPGGAVYAHPNPSTGAAVNISKSSLNDSIFGFRAEANVKAVLDDCVLAGNTNNAVVVQPVSVASKATLSRCTINDSGGYGVLANGSLATVFLSNNVIFNNGVGVGVLSGGGITSLGNNNINGNTTDGSPKP